jgi:hypothetical protein
MSCRNFQNMVRQSIYLSRLALLMCTIAEFHPLIGTVISEILDSFNAGDERHFLPGMYVGPHFQQEMIQ